VALLFRVLTQKPRIISTQCDPFQTSSLRFSLVRAQIKPSVAWVSRNIYRHHSELKLMKASTYGKKKIEVDIRCFLPLQTPINHREEVRFVKRWFYESKYGFETTYKQFCFIFLFFLISFSLSLSLDFFFFFSFISFTLSSYFPSSVPCFFSMPRPSVL